MKSKQIRRRHVKHSKFARHRKARSVYRAWLAKESARLASSDDLFAFTTSIAVKASNVFTFTGNPTNGETVSIGSQVYAFKTSLSVADDILIGASSDDTKDNLIAAINNAAGEGSTYGTGTAENSDVVAVSGGVDIMDVTAKLFGVIPNEVTTVDATTDADWDTVTLEGGLDSEISKTDHELNLDDGPFRLSNSGGSLPTGLAVDTDYFVVEVVDQDKFKFGLSVGADPEQAEDAGTGTHSYARFVEFTSSVAVEAANVFTFTGNPTNGETTSIGNQAYTFKTVLLNANDILIGAGSDNTKDNLIAAINNAAGEGSTYGTGTIENSDVVAVSGGTDIMDVTAKLFGVVGNSISTVDDTADADWDTATLTSGADSKITRVAHGLLLEDGPFRVFNSGGALPTGLSVDTDYFVVEVVDVDNIKFGLSRNSDPENTEDAGTGTHRYARCDDDDSCIHDLLRKNTSERIILASDIDDLS